MRRPVWLFSMDTEQFRAPPLTTGALKAYFLAYGRSAAQTEIELVHFLERAEVGGWLGEPLLDAVARAGGALASGIRPVFGLSVYTWNAAEFLELARAIKQRIPDALVIAGGPHVQRAEDFLGEEPIDVVVLGEGEATFAELLDAPDGEWERVAGCAFLDSAGRPRRTPPRGRTTDLDRLPSALEIVPLRDARGRPLYKQVAYETSRGCPYRCSFCEWGTGAIGTKIHQFSLERIGRDLERIAAGGIEDIWLCDSNFGALREDLAKAEMIVALRRRSGLPATFATSWSKNHNRRVQEIVRLLHSAGLLSHYHLALQTLTPRALELSHRKNMRANDYEPVVKSLAAEGVPVAAELIWGLPGDTLAAFEANLDHLLTVFPNINIFGYTLLPGTEFYERRHEYRLETVEVAGYGKAKGEYVVGCHTFSRDEGEEGYFLISSYIVLARGQIMPLTVQFLALGRRVSAARLLRAVLHALIDELADEIPAAVPISRISAYEHRAEIYLRLLAERERTYAVARRTIARWLADEGAADLIEPALKVLEIDRAFCPREGGARRTRQEFGFAAHRVEAALGRMELPPAEVLSESEAVALEIEHPGGVGEILRDPDGGAWVRGQLASTGT